MANFDVICPDHYPMKCNLSQADKDYLITKEKIKAFLIFRYSDQDDWIQPALERYFNERTWRLFNAGKEGGTGTKYCNVCRYALSSDFGIVSLTPFSYNVYQEIGLMQGLQKPLIYLLNPEKLNIKNGVKLPFDIDDQIYIEHHDAKTLLKGLDNKIQLITDKLILASGFDVSQRGILKDKYNNLSDRAKDLLKRLILEGDPTFLPDDQFDQWITGDLQFDSDSIEELRSKRFILSKIVTAGQHYKHITQLNEPYIKYLNEFLWEKISK